LDQLHRDLLAAHAAGDHPALVTLYTKAADSAPDLDTACFFLTHAYIFALELGHKDTATLHARLAEHGRV